MKKRLFLRKITAVSAAAALGGGAALFSSRSQAVVPIPEAGGRLGDAVGDLFGSMLNESLDGFLSERQEESDTEQDNLASAVPIAFDGMNHVEVTRYNQQVQMETAPLPDDCENDDHRHFQQASDKVDTLAVASYNRQYDTATLTIMAPLYQNADRAKEMRSQFGDDWVEVTSSAAHLFRPVDITAANSAATDAFILNVTARTSKNLARFTTAWSENDTNTYADASAIAAFTSARLPLTRQRVYITANGGRSARTNIHAYIENTLHSQVWRDQIRDLETEVQGLQMLLKQKAFENYIKLRILRELEIKLLIECHQACERVIHSIRGVEP